MPALFCHLFVESLIDRGDLGNPLLPLAVFQPHDLVIGPVEVKGDVGYLLEQPVRGVANYSPAISNSTSNSSSQWGQATARRLWPF